MTTLKPLKPLLAAVCMAFAMAHADAAHFALAPAATTVDAGTSFSLDLVGTDLVDLYAFQFALSFDPAVVHVLGVTEGPALSTAGTTYFVPGTPDNGLGLLGLTGDALIGAIPGFDGSGTLASISFSAVAGGSTSITLSDALVLNSDFLSDVLTLAAASVVVNGAAPVPEPATPLLMAAGLALLGAVAAVRRRRPSAQASSR